MNALKVNIGSKIVHGIFFIIATLSISLASILVLLSNASATACAFWRLLFSTLILITYTRLVRIDIKLVKDYLLFFIISGVSLGLHFSLWMDSLFRIPVAISTTIVITYPIHALIVEYFLKEKVNKLEIFGLCLSFLGILIYFYDSLFLKIIDIVGVLESFIASFLAAIYFLMGRNLRKKLSTFNYVIPTYLVGSVTVLLYSLVIGDNVLNYIPYSWYWFLALALIPMIGGHTLMNYLLKFYKSSTVTSIAFLEPIGASLLAYGIFKQMPKVRHILVMPMVILGTLLSILSERSSSKS